MGRETVLGPWIREKMKALLLHFLIRMAVVRVIPRVVGRLEIFGAMMQSVSLQCCKGYLSSKERAGTEGQNGWLKPHALLYLHERLQKNPGKS